MFRTHISGRPSPWPRYRGTAAVEFAIVLPVLMIIVIGATDLSRMLYYKNVLTNAARTGAAYGATHQMASYSYDDWVTQVEFHAREEAANLPGFNSQKLNIAVNTVDEDNSSYRVQVDVDYPFAMLFAWPGWPREVTLRHSVTMRRYR